MIGVAAKDSERKALEEFFELFKTPWELWNQEKDYDVVILSRDEHIDSLKARLIIIFGAETTGFDKVMRITSKNDLHTKALRIGELILPIYTGLSSFMDVGGYDPLIRQNGAIFAFKIRRGQKIFLRVGYNFFREIEYLLTNGQPAKNAAIPTLDIQITLLKTWILEAGLPIVEIPPVPEGHNFIACLTHDTDFIRIRDHFFDHTMGGFLYRAIFGSLINFIKGRHPFSRVRKNWEAVLSLPFVYLGMAKDYWFQFHRYEEIENGAISTFFLIPFKKRRGDKVHSARRATKYDIMDIPETAKILARKGYEISAHGIDAWHSGDKGRIEWKRINAVTRDDKIGIRMHWLLFDHQTFSALEKAGYYYDSTLGYNDAAGYRNGTTQVFRPQGAIRLLELPLNIQDTALFYPRRMNLPEKKALDLCDLFIKNAFHLGGVLTINWHQRSLAPERMWGDFYIQMLERVRHHRPWFATAKQAVEWYQKRREASFSYVKGKDDERRLVIRGGKMAGIPSLLIRIHRPKNQALMHADTQHLFHSPSEYTDIPWREALEMSLPA